MRVRFSLWVGLGLRVRVRVRVRVRSGLRLGFGSGNTHLAAGGLLVSRCKNHDLQKSEMDCKNRKKPEMECKNVENRK